MNPSPSAIDQLSQQLQAEKHPPVHLWHPEKQGDIAIHIARNGDWFYQGSLIQRPAMVRLFSTVLRRDGDAYFLVTPAEKLAITVEDVPFMAVSLDVIEEHGTRYFTFTSNVGDRVIAGAKHPLCVTYENSTGEPSPYIEIRHGLYARLTRAVFYQTAEYCEEVEGQYLIRSGDARFVLGSVATV